MANFCWKCGKELEFLENMGNDEKPLCRDCYQDMANAESGITKIKISSSQTFIFKRIMPVFFFGAFALFNLAAFQHAKISLSMIPSILSLIVFGVIMYLLISS